MKKVLVVFASVFLAAGVQSSSVEKESVVLAHGILNKPFVMKRIARALEKEGYRVYNWGYPSTEKGIEEIAADAEAYVASLPPAEKVHFVGFSLGTQVLRGYLARRPPVHAGRFVMIAPPNHGSPVIEKIRDIPGVTWVYGEKAFLQMEGDGKNAAGLDGLGVPRVPFGVIAGGLGNDAGFSPLIIGDDDGSVPVEGARLEGMSDFLLLPHEHTWLLARAETADQVVSFIRDGRFRRAGDAPCALKADEDAVFFPTDAVRRQDGRWDVTVDAWVYEPERRDLSRAPLLGALRRALGADPSAREERLRPFLSDNERGKKLVLMGGGETFRLPPTGADGRARATWTVSASGDRWDFALQGCAGDGRSFSGTARLVPPEGVSVVSDIDDTVKVSQVRDRRALMENTFSRPFVEAPGMAALYRRWADEGALFHYVSASPWHLHGALSRFMADAGFPEGTFLMKSFRWKDATFWSLFQDPLAYKVPLLTDLIARFPGRRFILVGDDGEMDPEIYGEIFRAFPANVDRIYIRRVTDDGEERFSRAFKGVPREKWALFETPDGLPGLK